MPDGGQRQLKLKPIATVRNGVTGDVDDWDKVKSRLVLDKELVDGLYRLNRFDHVLVIFGFHRKRGVKLRVHPRHDPAKPLSVRGNVVTVKGLDAYDGSPVFDIKPPLDEIDY
jgi:tRNA (Thr-GGU) A37 N-methylase